MPRRRRSPPEKKQLSLERDHPISKQTLRKLMASQQRAAERGRRAADRVALASDPDGFAPARREQAGAAGGATLADIVARKRERRANQTPRKSQAARTRRRVRRRRRGSR